MNLIEKYNESVRRMQMFRVWAGLIGDRYSGGGGGIGSVTSASFKATIYHQEYNGATNYHDSAPYMDAALQKAAIAFAPQIISRAQQYLQEEVDAAASAAEEEAREVLAAISKEVAQ